MECREIRDLAEAYVSEQVLVETAQAIVSHLDRCQRCHAEVEGLRRLRASVRAAYVGSRDLSPTPAFVGALHSRLRTEAMGAHQVSLWRHRWLAVAATVVLMIGGGFGFRGLGVSGFTAILQAAVGDHRYCLVTFRLTERPIELEKAARLYNDPVDRSLESVRPASDQLSGGPLRILERHSCVYHGRRFAHIVVRYKGALTSFVVTPDDRLLRHLPGASAPSDGSIVTLPPVDGFQVAAFRGPQHVVFVISTLADDDVREVARSMAGSISRAMKAT